MNKSDLIDHIAQDAGIMKTQASAAIESLMENITRALKDGNKVTLVGFGTFTVIKRASRKGRNPATGATIRIKAKKVVKFRGGYELLARI